MNPSQPVLGRAEAPADAQINPSGDSRRLLMKLCTHILQQLTTDWPIPVAHQQSAPPPVVIKASAAAQDTKPDSAQLNEAWQLLHSRSLQDDPIVAIWLRGLCPRGVNIVLGAGLTITGYRRILGLVACYPENVSALASFVQSLSDRGLSAASGLLCVLPSSTGLQSAVRQVFGPRVAIQRCLNTLLDQVTCGLPEDLVPVYRNRLRQAWNGFDAREAERALTRIHQDLTRVNRSAAKVLWEGLEQSLTIQRTGMLLKLDRGLRVMRFMDAIGRRLQAPASAVFQQREQMALALLEHEAQLRRVAHAAHLPQLRETLINLNAV